MRQVIQAAVHIGRSYFREVLKWMRKFGHLSSVCINHFVQGTIEVHLTNTRRKNSITPHP